MEFFQNSLFTGLIIGVFIIFGIIFLASRLYKKTKQGQALVRTGIGGIKVSFNGLTVIPVFQRLEVMDISLKTIMIHRHGNEGLICQDNMRADIKVTFFVRVNEKIEDVKKVAQSVGCVRASSKEALEQLFDAKFSEALKTVGKKFNFVDLYNQRDEFRKEIVNLIGTDLNGYVLDDCAIDYLEQTPLSALDENNILDSEGIKKIRELTANQKIKANHILRDKEKTIKQQDVEAREAILEMERQLAETEERQNREVQSIKAREGAEILKVQEEERLKAEKARIQTEEELQVAEENKLRQIVVAAKNKERTDAVETERVEKDRLLEVNERERVVTLAQIDKEKSIEIERKNIQEVIRERVAIQKSVVDEEERIKDTRAFAEADRMKKVAVTKSEEEAEAELVKAIKSAEAQKQAAEHKARQLLIEAEAEQASAAQRAEAIKTLAEADAAKHAAQGIAEAQVMEAKADAREKQGEAEASVLEAQALAEAKGIEAKSNAQAEADLKIGEASAEVDRKRGFAEAEVIQKIAEADKEKGLAEALVAGEKYTVDAQGIEAKAEAMKKLDGVGKEHEEFKLRLEKDKEVELASINIQAEIAEAQAEVLGTALENAKIDIVGGENVFFDKIVGAISNGKATDRLVDNSNVLSDVRRQLLGSGDEDGFIANLKEMAIAGGISAEGIRDLSVAALIAQLIMRESDPNKQSLLEALLGRANDLGLANKSLGDL
ncbi:SPFH domain-containing protein [Sanyastnella coralliicola]|uniref:SPFH domain-containing protein n=1 Tax=Sanyastnella coralliicola TaxID=3069118 RepID=UPI0027BA0A80|nr:SPFH domain-containing protein [Longitalea sp. SCSIO 12813]